MRGMILFGCFAGAALGWWARAEYERREKKRETDQAWENTKAGWGAEYIRERYWDSELTRIFTEYALGGEISPPPWLSGQGFKPACYAHDLPGPGFGIEFCHLVKGHEGPHQFEPPRELARGDR